jgi:hypothetical protein
MVGRKDRPYKSLIPKAPYSFFRRSFLKPLSTMLCASSLSPSLPLCRNNRKCLADRARHGICRRLPFVSWRPGPTRSPYFPQFVELIKIAQRATMLLISTRSSCVVSLFPLDVNNTHTRPTIDLEHCTSLTHFRHPSTTVKMANILGRIPSATPSVESAAPPQSPSQGKPVVIGL